MIFFIGLWLWCALCFYGIQLLIWFLLFLANPRAVVEAWRRRGP